MSGRKRWARALLWLYPARFRTRHGDEYLRVFAADWSATEKRPTVARIARRARLLAEAVAFAAAARGGALGAAFATGRRSRPAIGSGAMLDLASAVRDLRRSPGFTAAAVLTLAAGIGVNTTAYTIVEGVALRPLPYRDAERLAAVRIEPHDGQRWHGLSVDEFTALERRTDLFAGIGGIRPNYAEVLPIELDITGVERPEKVQGVEVTPGMLATLGIAPQLGRGISAEDRDGPEGQTLGLMLSHEYWTRAFAGNPDVLGDEIIVEHRPKTIVGVLPPGLRLLMDPDDGVPVTADLWALAHWFTESNTDTHYLRTIVRLRDDVELDRARAALDTIAAGWRDARPDIYGEAPPRLELTPLRAHLVAGSRPLLTALVAAVGLVLLIACANTGSLILARSRARARDLAVRRALGASAARIARLVLVESLVLALLGGFAGLALAAVSMRVVASLATDVLPRAGDIGMSAGTVAVGFALAIASGVVAGMLAVVQAGGGNTVDQLRQGTRLAGSRGAQRYRGTLTVLQTAVAVVLLVGAGLMLRTLANLASIDLGFRPEGVFTFKVEMDQTRIALGPPRYEFFRDVAAAVARQPELDNASAIFVLPTHGGFGVDGYGRTVEELDANEHEATFNVVLPGYFDTMGIPLLSGADFDPEWPDGDDGAVIIDELIAERLWPGAEAVGRTLVIDFDMQNPEVRDRVTARVVGVARHTRQDGIRDVGTPQIYVPHWHRPFWGMNFVARVRDTNAGGPAMAAAAAAVQRVVDADPDAIFTHSGRPLAAVIAEGSHDGRLLTRVLATFSALALLLSATGLYGVLSYAARQRTREIGIRRAAGARSTDIAWLVLRSGLGLSSAGVALGMVGAMWLSQLLSSLLFGVAAADPLTYAVAGGVLFLVGVLAAATPARRATAVDPVQALRAE